MVSKKLLLTRGLRQCKKLTHGQADFVFQHTKPTLGQTNKKTKEMYIEKRDKRRNLTILAT